MRGSFWRFHIPKDARRWGCTLCGAEMLALCALCVLASGCSRALPFSGLSGAPPPLSAPPCDAMRAASKTLAATPPPIITWGRHRVYGLTSLGPLPTQTVWRSGASMRFLWCALPQGETADAKPHRERMTVQIIGPFASRADAGQAQRSLFGPPRGQPTPTPGPVVTSAAAVETDTWANVDESSALQLPATLTPGYYVFVTDVQVLPIASSDQPSGESRGSGIIEVRPG